MLYGVKTTPLNPPFTGRTCLASLAKGRCLKGGGVVGVAGVKIK